LFVVLTGASLGIASLGLHLTTIHQSKRKRPGSANYHPPSPSPCQQGPSIKTIQKEKVYTFFFFSSFPLLEAHSRSPLSSRSPSRLHTQAITSNTLGLLAFSFLFFSFILPLPLPLIPPPYPLHLANTGQAVKMLDPISAYLGTWVAVPVPGTSAEAVGDWSDSTWAAPAGAAPGCGAFSWPKMRSSPAAL